MRLIHEKTLVILMPSKFDALADREEHSAADPVRPKRPGAQRSNQSLQQRPQPRHAVSTWQTETVCLLPAL